MKSIVTSINAYNFHLFISYLDEGIEIIRFEDFRNKFRQIKTPYIENINIKNTLSEIIFINNNLFGIEENKLKTFPLNNSTRNFSEIDFSNVNEISQMSFDYNTSSLFIFDNNSIVDKLTVNYKNLQTKNRFRIKSLEDNEDKTVSNMISSKNEIYLSIRGFGVSEITENSHEIIYRTEDAQDVCYFDKNKTIIVADAFDGLVFFEKNNPNPIRKIKLFDNDFAQEIKIFNNNILIKGKYGLYIYDIYAHTLNKIWNESVGDFTTYYDMIFFSSKSIIHMLTKNETTISYFKLSNSNKSDIKIDKYFR